MVKDLAYLLIVRIFLILGLRYI